MADVEHHEFDELAVGSLSDVAEEGDAIIEEAHYQGIAKLGITTGTYYTALREMGVSKKHALKLTREWMQICSWND